MSLRQRVPALVLAVLAVALMAVIVQRVSAGAEPAPEQTSPVVLSPSTSPSPTAAPTTAPTRSPGPTPTTRPTKSPSSDAGSSGHGGDDYTAITPKPRDVDDHRGKGGGGDDRSGHGGSDDSGSSDGGSGRDHPEDD